jgi:hypothetical protein
MRDTSQEMADQFMIRVVLERYCRGIGIPSVDPELRMRNRSIPAFQNILPLFL